MSTVRAIDQDGDWILRGKAAYLSGQQALAQQILCRLYSFLGNCFFDTEAGVDWFNILGASDITAINLALSSTILNTVGVTQIARMDSVLDSNTRKLKVTFQVNSIYGVFNGAFQFNGTV
jgi:hypothetical protein